MPKSNAIDAFGTKLQRETAPSSGTYVSIAEVTDISGPGLDRVRIERTHHESPGAFREYLMGLKEVQEFSIDIQYVPTDGTHDAATGLIADWNAGTERNYKLLFPDTTEWIFPTFVANFEPAAPIDDKLQATVTFRPSGQPTLA